MQRPLLLFPLVLAVVGCAPAAAPLASAPDRPAQAGLCVACHGPDGMASLPAHPHLAGQDEAYLRESLLKFRSGERVSPPMQAVVGSLSNDDIAALARYYAGLPHGGPTARTP